MIELAKTLDRAAKDSGVDFVGGFTALVEKGISKGDLALIEAIPEALPFITRRMLSSDDMASTG